MPVAYIALGSNLGDRLAHLRQAVRALKELQLDPALKGPMDRGLIAVDFRDPVPLAAGANPKDNAIQDAPGVGTFPPGRTGRIELID